MTTESASLRTFANIERSPDPARNGMMGARVPHPINGHKRGHWILAGAGDQRWRCRALLVDAEEWASNLGPTAQAGVERANETCKQVFPSWKVPPGSLRKGGMRMFVIHVLTVLFLACCHW
jgi:hypothetical protein